MDIPENQTELEHEFWKTLELLVSREWKRTEKDVMEDVQDWVDTLVAKRDTVEEEELTTAKTNKTEKSSEYQISDEKELKDFINSVKLPKFDCKFSHPYVRSRLEKLMGSNMISLTDRAFMQQLQERILENYSNEMNKRISVREAQERERVKNLVLTGKLSLNKAPPEMANHPVRLIEIYCQKLIAERRAKIKVQKVFIPRHMYWDDIPDPPSGLSIESGHVFRKATERLCHPPDCILKESTAEDVDRGYMFVEDDYVKLTVENPLITQLRECETVEEMYELADEIIGVLKSVEPDISAAAGASAK